MGNAPFDVDYSIEGADVGYRWFARRNETPLFPFGYGLSYASFHVSNVAAQGGGTISVGADVTNDGALKGKETVQVYAAPPGDDAPEMLRLIGWSKVDLKPGETRRISLTADPRLRCRKPAGAFYMFVDISDVLSADGFRTSLDFADALLEESRVAVTPGEAFDAPGTIRISYATSMELLKEGSARLLAFVAKHAPQTATAG